MAIPSERDIEVPLLQEIVVVGGEARPASLYDKVATHFPQLTSADQKARHPGSGLPIWTNRVRWARQNLVIDGEIDASTRGIWRITDKGRARLDKAIVRLEGVPPPPPPPTSTIGELLDKEKQQIRSQLRELLMNLHPQ